MNKTFTAVIIVIVMLVLSGCQLVQPMPDGKEDGLVFNEDYLVGMFVYVKKYDISKGGYSCYPTDDFEDKNAMALYVKTVENSGTTYTSLESVEYFYDANIAIADSDAAPNGKITVEATFYYTYELLGGMLSLNKICKKQNENEYYVGQGSSNAGLSAALTSLSIEQNLKASKKISGKSEELTYDGKITLNMRFIDYLRTVTVSEFDAGGNVLKRIELDRSSWDEGGGSLAYEAHPECDYLIFEENYEVMHEGGISPKGTKYVVRSLKNKNDEKAVYFLFPEGNGFAKALGIKFVG